MKNNIKITNLIVIPENVSLAKDEVYRDCTLQSIDKNSSYGESKGFVLQYAHISDVIRLRDHISLLLQFAHRYYENNSSKQNHIVRICTHEFSLYTEGQPLRIGQFKELLYAIRRLASKMPHDIHLLLSSFGVQNNFGGIYNCTCYIQCGAQPEIHILTKDNFSEVDITYADMQNCRLFDTVSSCKIDQNLSFSNDPLIYCKTSAGMQLIVAIDICLDHVCGKCKKRILVDEEQAIKQIQIDHIVVSNSVWIDHQFVITDHVTHIDPWYYGVYDIKTLPHKPVESNPDVVWRHIEMLKSAKYEPIPIQLIDEIAWNNRLYNKLKIDNRNGKIQVKNPPFGGDYHIEAYQLGNFWLPN